MIKEVRDGYGQNKGIIQYDGNDENSNAMGITSTGKVVGRYLRLSNVTFDKNDRVYGTGNLLESLIRIES